MLPGFRFLLAAIVLCISILVFGLGAAALLRAAHEEFVQNPSWRGPPEPRFAQSEEPPRTVLAMLRAEPASSTEPTTATDALASEVRVAPAEAPPPTPPAADKTAAPYVQETSPPIESTGTDTSKIEASEPETSRTETSKSEMPPEPTAGGLAPAVTAAATDRPAAADIRTAAVELAPPAANEQSAATVPAAAPAPEPDPAEAKIASLGRPAVAIEPDGQLEIEAIAEQDEEEAKQRLRAQHAKERRRLAARRPHLAKQQLPARPPAAQLFQPLQLPLDQVTPTQTTQQIPQTRVQTAAARRTRAQASRSSAN